MMEKPSQRCLVADIFENHRSFWIGNSRRPPGGVVERCSGRDSADGVLSLRLLRWRLGKKRLRLHEREADEQSDGGEKAAIRFVVSHLDQSLNLIRFDINRAVGFYLLGLDSSLMSSIRWRLTENTQPVRACQTERQSNCGPAAGLIPFLRVALVDRHVSIHLRVREHLNPPAGPAHFDIANSRDGAQAGDNPGIVRLELAPGSSDIEGLT